MIWLPELTAHLLRHLNMNENVKQYILLGSTQNRLHTGKLELFSDNASEHMILVTWWRHLKILLLFTSHVGVADNQFRVTNDVKCATSQDSHALGRYLNPADYEQVSIASHFGTHDSALAWLTSTVHVTVNDIGTPNRVRANRLLTRSTCYLLTERIAVTFTPEANRL